MSFMLHFVFRVVMAWYMGVKEELYILSLSLPNSFSASANRVCVCSMCACMSVCMYVCVYMCVCHGCVST